MKHYKDSENNLFGYDDNVIPPEGLTEITMTEVDAIVEAKQQAALDALPYDEKRAAAYPSIQDQLDMQYWDSVNGTTTWADAIAQVKADYPKGAE